MSIIDVEHCIWDLHRHRSSHAIDFESDPEAFLARYDLTADEHSALLAKDYGSLYRMGVHPMAVLFYSQVNKTPMPAYLAAIGSAAERIRERETLERGDAT